MTRAEQAMIVLLAVVVGWAGVDAWQVSRADVPPPPPPWPEADRGSYAFAARSYQEVVRRSLFTPSRRADFASAADNPAAVGGFLLRGVLFGSSGQLALFEPLRGGKAVRLTNGAMIGGYRIVGFEPDGVVLERDGQRRPLYIDFESLPPDRSATAMEGMLAGGDADVGAESETDGEPLSFTGPLSNDGFGQ